MAKKIKEYFDEFGSAKFVVDNHIYYSFLFITIFAVHLLHLLVIRESLSFSFIYYAVSALLQAFIEVSFLVILGKVIKKYGSNKLFGSYVVLTFLLAAIHLIDFPFVRLMDMSIWFIFRFLSHESLDSFIEMLYASNISLFVWFASLIGSILAIIGSILFFKYLERHSLRKPFRLSNKSVLVTLLFLPSALVLWNSTFVEYIEEKEHSILSKVLPWKSIFGKKQGNTFELDLFKGDKNESDILTALTKSDLQAKPDIFLFIAESLREDYITAETGPNLFNFKKEHFYCDHALSGGNATHLSWYSIFYSKPAMYWGIGDHPDGSYYLKYLKDQGYTINVLSCARLSYYQMDKCMFGNRLQNIDHLESFKLSEDMSVYEGDKGAVYRLIDEVNDHSKTGGRVFIVFLDSTHFSYSFPADEKLPFTPCPESINYLQATLSKKVLPGLINRYQNAIYFMDRLFGEFMSALKNSPSWKASIVVFTGDHGEEFYERGHLFHASNLCRQQSRVPLYMKLGTLNPQDYSVHKSAITTHLDIMPTVFNVLHKDKFQKSAFYGKSILQSEKNKYASFARYNASMNPDEFAIQGDGFKAILKKKELLPVTSCKEYVLLEVTDEEDNKLQMPISEVSQKLKDAYQCLFLQNIES